MYKLSVDKIRQGMCVARNIYNAQGICLLSKGTVLDEIYIRRLQELGVFSVYIAVTKYDLDDAMSPLDIVHDSTRIDAIKNIFQAFNNFQFNNYVELTPLKLAANNIIDDLRQNEWNMVQLNDVRMYDQYTFNHSVNVAVLATMIGVEIGYNQQQLDQLAIGALMHDVGKMFVPIPILNKPGRLNNDEFSIIRKHPQYGFNILLERMTMSDESMSVVLQHHESYDGSGYPNGLRGDSIAELARIVTIADVYDALTSDRVYKKAYLPSVAYRMMNGILVDHFDREIMEMFFRHVALYPAGAVVRLMSGGYAIVKEVNNDDTLRPKIEIVADKNRQAVKKRVLLDLRNYKKKMIDGVLEEKEALDIYALVGNMLE